MKEESNQLSKLAELPDIAELLQYITPEQPTFLKLVKYLRFGFLGFGCVSGDIGSSVPAAIAILVLARGWRAPFQVLMDLFLELERDDQYVKDWGMPQDFSVLCASISDLSRLPKEEREQRLALAIKALEGERESKSAIAIVNLPEPCIQ